MADHVQSAARPRAHLIAIQVPLLCTMWLDVVTFIRDGGCVMKGIWSQEISEPTLAQVARDMFHRGYGVIADFFSEDDLEPIRKLALHAGEVAGGEYTGFTGPDAFRGTTLGELPDHEPFRDLCRRLYELGTSQQAPEIGFYQIFRCLQGRGGLKNSYIFHYDSYVLTVLLPIAVSNSGLKGNLLMFPNLRPIRSTYVRNLWDKFLVDNPISQLFLRRVAKRATRGPLAIQIQPGNAYFFWDTGAYTRTSRAIPISFGLPLFCIMATRIETIECEAVCEQSGESSFNQTS